MCVLCRQLSYGEELHHKLEVVSVWVNAGGVGQRLGEGRRENGLSLGLHVRLVKAMILPSTEPWLKVDRQLDNLDPVFVSS